MCAEIECCTKTELCKASNYIMAQILCSEKSRCAVEKRVGFFLSSYSQSTSVFIQTEAAASRQWQLSRSA